MILALTGPEEELEFRLGWSLWRRAHQAVARRCHTARRAFRHERTLLSQPSHPVTSAAADAAPAPMNVHLTDEGWELLKPLFCLRRNRPSADRGAIIARYSPECYGS